MIKVLIFDLGGVVLNRGLWLFRNYLVEKYNVTDEATIAVFIKKYYKLYFSGNITEKEFWESSLSDLGIKADWLELREILFNFYKPNDGMFELLDMLKVRGYRNILLSDQTNEWWPALNQKWKIDSYFDYCIISAEIGINKPDERIYKLALEKSQASADSIVFIDDLEENLLPAEKLEFKTVLYQDTEQLKKDLIALKVI